MLCMISGQLDFYMVSIPLVCVYIHNSIFILERIFIFGAVTVLGSSSLDAGCFVVSLHGERKAGLVGLGMHELH